ncbi:hypothetical protein FRC01_012968 [Tulasnella sp. 417]|nr:hypothetical protein FRC01_012968 [Tulasnella sp. 417]
MPEIQEGEISNATVSNAIAHIKQEYGSVENGPRCITAYGDLTEAEKEADAKIKRANAKGYVNGDEGLPSGTNAQLGLPIELKLNNKSVRALQRGMTSRQTPILFGTELEPPGGYTDLQLLEVITSPRNVIVKLHPRLYLQVQLLTATAVNVYTQDAFHNGLMRVSRQIRKFSITLALDFGAFVLAFVSSDGITQFHWASRMEDLPAKHADPVRDFGAYLSRFVAWLSVHSPSTKRAAQEVIRGAGEIFPGIGMYTVNELFARAGLPIDLPDHLLWSCICCVARLLEALWTVHAVASERVQTLLSPMLAGGLTLGVTVPQRVEYAQSLLVYGKHQMKSTSRMREQCDEYNECISKSETPVHHVFEPSLIASALQKPAGPNLSHLIFKSEDRDILSGTSDPLTHYAHSKGLLHTCGQHVHPITDKPRFLDISSYKKSKVTTCMILIKKKHMWSLMNPNQAWGIGSIESSEDKACMLFHSRVTNSVKEVIGPRDYVGMPRRITMGRSTVLMVCNFDPRLPPRFMNQVLKQVRKIRPDTAARWEKEHKAWLALVEKAHPTLVEKPNCSAPQDNRQDEDASGPARKKQRMSADKRMAMAYGIQQALNRA